MAWRTVRASVSAAAGVCAGVATVYLGMVQSKTIHPHSATPKEQGAALAMVGVVAVGSSLTRPLRALFVARAYRQKEKIAAALRGLPWVVNEITDGLVPVRPLGASAWVVQKFPWPARLNRICRERVNDIPGPSKIRWTRNKGVIGLCWETGREQIVDTHSIHSPHSRCTEEDWDRLPDETRMGLSFQEFSKIQGKYGTVIAVPITDEKGNVVGCVTLDAPEGFHEQLSQPDVVEKVSNSAAVVGRLIG